MASENEPDLENLPCGIFKVCRNRKLLYGNRYALELLDCKFVDDVVGLKIEELVSFATCIFLDSYVYPMLLSEGKADEVQLSLNPLAGRTIPIVANIRIDPDKTTYWTFMSCINRDQLYNELLDARDTLQIQAQALGQLNSRSRERQSGLKAFCHSLSHDFTGPLRRIRQLIEFAVEDLQNTGIKAPAEFKLLNSAQRNSDTLIELISGLVEYLVSDVEVSLDEVVDLKDIVSTIMRLRDQQGSKSPKVHWRTHPSFFGSNSQMQVLFKNLIENAIKYNENTPEITIGHTVDRVGGSIVIAIEDNGIGMSEAYLDTIFTPFARLHNDDKYEGSGLGLSIVRKMVLNHDGDIRVESKPGSGSTFFVSLPLKPSSRFKYDDD